MIDTMNPLDVVVRILDNQLSTLMWIDEKVRVEYFFPSNYISFKYFIGCIPVFLVSPFLSLFLEQHFLCDFLTDQVTNP